MASLPAFDGWADQYFCYDETKDYVLPNNRHATQYYHDHAVGITSENAYNGAHCCSTCWQLLLDTAKC
jgi:spore coat protein A, manganese oxidase